LLRAAAVQLAARADHDEIIMLRASSGARRLHAIITRPASTAAGSIFKDSLSFSTELSLHRRRPARRSMATGRDASHGFTAKVVNDRFTVMSLGYDLTTLLKRTLSYAFGWDGATERGAINLGF